MDSQASPQSVVEFHNARFTVLTDRMLRLEWAEDGIFEDRATLTAVNRRLPTPEFNVEKNGKSLTLRTSALTLEYQETGKSFKAENLSIRFDMNGTEKVWTPGKKDSKNLNGTARTLDGHNGDTAIRIRENKDGSHTAEDSDQKIKIDNGLISRNGWAVVDDSKGVVLDPDTGAFTPWAQSRPKRKRQDLYFLGYGLNFKTALGDAAKVFGHQPLPPRFALGYWYSRYWAYTDREIEELVDQFDRMDVPLDVMVIDMDWHLPGWTGYTWDRDFFPDPDDLLKKLKDRGIKVTLNLHPADGVAPHEEAFEDMCNDLGLNPKTTDRIPFDCTDPKYMESYFKRLHHPEEKRGVDFWWMDWQQGEETKIPGLDPLAWLNHLHWMDQRQQRPDQRPLNFSRYCGLGSGRYPVGFSGDTAATWRSLDFQPRFTATANNVLYGAWSHDIGGHFGDEIDPELYTRWMQFGLYSPALRTHSTKDPKIDRRIWIFPEPYNHAMADVLRRRYELVPYIYTELRKTEDSGVSLLHPMYVEHPEEKEAYKYQNQYYFGDVMIVAPVTAVAEPISGAAKIETWLPPGEWYDAALGRLVQGDAIYPASYVIDETPVFVRAGAVVPGQANAKRLGHGSYPELIVDAYPGGDGEYRLYEDDGHSTAYRDGKCAWIPLAQKTKNNHRFITVGKAEGDFEGFQKNRKVTFRLHGTPPPETVKLDGNEIDWRYDGDHAIIVVEAKELDLSENSTLEVMTATDSDGIFTTGWRGFMRRMVRIARDVNSVSPYSPLHPEERLATHIAQTGNRISRNPKTVQAEIAAFKHDLQRLPKVFKQYRDAFKKKKNTRGVEVLERAMKALDSD